MSLKQSYIDRLKSCGVSLSPSYACYVHKWNITRRLSVRHDSVNAESNHLRGINLFLNEKCNWRHVLQLRKALRATFGC